MVRLLGIDVDGTLLDTEGRLPDANRDAIHAAVAAGIHVALVTGRSYPFARPVAETLPPSITLIVSSGAVERATDGTTLARRLLDRGVARCVLDATREFREHTAVIFDRDEERQIIFESMDWTHPNRQSYWDRNHWLIDRATPLEDSLIEDPIQVMFNGDPGVMRQLSESLDRYATRMGDSEPPCAERSRRSFAVSLTEYLHRDFSLLDITAPDATKGRALEWRARQLGIVREEIMAVGDNFNDLDMLEAAGIPVVMGNAVRELRRPGWHVTGDQNDAGLAQAIEKFVLRSL
jgi:hydroxymethylpyrimidine pyrophosphatase-like HAD family hydrolase